MGTVDAFVEDLPPARQVLMRKVVDVASRAEPASVQGTSYGMPALLYRGRPLLGFAAAKAHLSIFPFSPDVVEAVRDRLGGYSLSKGTIRFTEDAPLPGDVVADIVRHRRDEIDRALG